MPRLVLGSTSPRRLALMREMGLTFEVIPPDADESAPEGCSPEGTAIMLATRKARSVAADLDSGLVVGADTLVALGDEIIGKPQDRRHAVEILRKLTRSPHRVITGVCIIDAADGTERADAESTRVTMRPMSEEEIAAYVDSGEAMGKAGAYAIQETGDRFVEHIEGSLSNVVGLPCELLERMLKECGYKR